MLEDLFIADIFFIYLIIPVKKIFQTLGDKNETLGDKNGYSHPLFYGSFMWECSFIIVTTYYNIHNHKTIMSTSINSSEADA